MRRLAKFTVDSPRRPGAALPAVVLVVAAGLLALPTVALAHAPAAGSGAGSSRTGGEAVLSTPGIIIIFPQPSWNNVSAGGPGAAPPALSEASSAYDAEDQETVLFGGCLDTNCSLESDQTWVFAAGEWTNVTSGLIGPSARTDAAMDYDANLHGVLLFGGQGPKGTILDDTWLFSGDRWTNVTSYSAPPPPRYGAAMAFDPETEENGSVLFGGYNYISGYLNDTWVWQGDAGWVALKSTSLAPPPVTGTSMAYDAADGYIVQTGGYDYGIGGDDPYTWELYSGQWWNVTPKTSPPARSYASMVYDPGLHGVLLFGGYSYETDTQNNLTWLFSDGSWTKKAPPTPPSARDSMALALDGTGTVPILYGGYNATHGTLLNDTWAYEFPPQASVGSNVSAAEVGESVTFTASLSDGTGPYLVRFAFGDGSYAVAAGSGPTVSATHAFATAGSFNVTAEVTDAVGAKATSGIETFSVSAGPTITAHATPAAGDVGHPLDFNSSLSSGGTPPVSYLWEFGDGKSASTEDASHAYGTAGTFPVSVTATDADGVKTTARLSVTVVNDPTVAASLAPTSPGANQAATFFASVSGGTGPFTYTWLFGDKSGSALPDPVHVYNTSGTYTVSVWANDSVGGSAHASITVTVSAPTTSLFPSISGAPAWFWGAVGGLLVVGAAGSFFLLRRSRVPKT